MPSKLKSDTARANGAKSRGPKTAETRQKSSRNSLKHGFTARHTMLLSCEDPEKFQQLVEEYTSVYQPTNPVERNLVEEMIGAMWRIRRLKAIEIALVDYEMIRQEPELEKEMTRFDPGIHMGVSYGFLSDGSRSTSHISRYEARLHRIHARSHSMLLDLRRAVISGLIKPALPLVAPEPPAPPATTEETSPPPPQTETTPTPRPASSTKPNRPALCGKKSGNEPSIRRVLRQIRNPQHPLNAAFCRFNRGPASAGQARSRFLKAS
jgi:hypothetical protein